MAPGTSQPTRWGVAETAGPARSLHERPVDDDPEPAVWIHETTGPALVLGSSQGDDVIDTHRTAATGVEVCRRRSGGGVVALLPRNDLWIDVVIPSSSRLWDDDVGRAFGWVGATWAAALSAVLPPGSSIAVSEGGLQNRDAGRVVCFAGLGPGEVTVDGRKVVGLSQRRSRHAARFQTVMTWAWPGRWVAEHLRPAALADGGLDRSSVEGLAAGLPRPLLEPGARPSIDAVLAAFLAELPEP